VDTVSIVIPTVNEEAALPRTLAHLRGLDPAPDEVVVVDGGSTDRTVAIAESWGVRVLHTPLRRRSVQLHAGAEAARGELLCFLHADTWLPPDGLAIVRRTLHDPRVAAGGFVSLMSGPRGTRWATSFHNFIKTYYGPLLFRPVGFFVRGLRLLFGDQVIFCRRAQYLRVGGFSDEAVMEEAGLCERLSRCGRIVQVKRTVVSSDRRVQRWGFVRAHATYLGIALWWGLRLGPDRWRRFYPDVRSALPEPPPQDEVASTDR
jgi:rSAM/selenodomain-associated transferase 2